MSKLPLNPNVEIFRWGPIPGKYFFPSIFSFPYTILNQRYGKVMWPAGLFLFNEGRQVYVNEAPRVAEYGSRAFREFVLNAPVYRQVLQEWKKANDELTQINQKIAGKNVPQLSRAELKSIWQELRDILADFWVPGLLLELANYGAEDVLQKALSAHIPNATQLTRATEILTAPEVPSFYQEEEIELSKTNNLTKHQQKWFWIRNSYYATEVVNLNFFAQRKAELPPNLKQKTADHIAIIKRQKSHLINRYQLPEEVVHIAAALWKGLAWQDNRKKHIFINLHYNQLLLAEIARRFNYELDDLLNIGVEEISDLLAGKDLRAMVETRRHKPFGFDMGMELTVLSNADAARFWELYSKDKIVDAEKLTGTVASRGHTPIVQARVTILLNPAEAGEFPAGHILVAPMTSPEYIFAMKKASAIITDAGGLTSHAAIVSRELHIPCIVGTRVATQVLKDGDMIEVDANTGIVRKI